MKQGSILTKAPALFAIGASALLIIFFILSFGSIMSGDPSNQTVSDPFSKSEVKDVPRGPSSESGSVPRPSSGNNNEVDAPPSDGDVADAKEALRKVNEKRDAYLKKRSSEKLGAIVGGAEEREKRREKVPKRGAYNKRPGSLYKPVPTIKVGPGHNTDGDELYPLYGDDLDYATELFEKQSDADPYDYPEKADELAKPGSIWAELVANYKNQPVAFLTQANESAMCLLSAVYTGNCKYLDESFYDCVVRLGADRIQNAMSEKCRKSDIWRDVKQRALLPGVPEKADKNTPIKYGKVVESETCTAEQRQEAVRYVPPQERHIAPFGPPRQCKNGAYQYPIAFGVPAKNVQDRLFPKLFDFNPVPLDIPPKPFTFNDEDSYQALAATSHFCMTHSRGGWDCGRHYEIMGAGCVPYFIDIHAMPPYILSQMPVRLFQEIVREPQFKHIGYVTGAYRDYFRNLSTSVDAGKTVRMSPHFTLSSFNFRGRVKVSPKIHWHFDHSQFDVTNYWRVARKLFRFTRKYLTSEALASYVLTTMGAADAKRVLVVSRNDYDNLHMSLVTGLDGLGVETTVVTARETQGLYKCFNLLKGRSASFDLPWPDTSLIATRRTSYGVSRHGVHGSGIPWANRAHSSKKLTFASRLKVVQHRLFGHMSADKFNASVFDLEHALQLPSPTSPNAPPAITSTTSAVAANNDSAAPKVISKRLLAEIANDKKLSLLHRQEELSFKDSKNRKERIEEEHDKLQPYYDAIIISYYSTSKFPVEMVRTLSAAVDGRIAVTDHEDTMGDPRAGSEEIAKQAFFFSRELRRVNC
eukprot:GILI01005102.1.p1 GENE.GILI01005102.1~~GILI01005102.1.p1  ORF type:complete len:829 (+),score=83.14 GILI01005102.1:57-2489(+)